MVIWSKQFYINKTKEVKGGWNNPCDKDPVLFTRKSDSYIDISSNERTINMKIINKKDDNFVSFIDGKDRIDVGFNNPPLKKDTKCYVFIKQMRHITMAYKLSQKQISSRN